MECMLHCKIPLALSQFTGGGEKPQFQKIKHLNEMPSTQVLFVPGLQLKPKGGKSEVSHSLPM